MRCTPASAIAMRPSSRLQAVPRRAQPVREDRPLAAGERERDQLAGDGVAHQQAFAVETHALRLVEPVERQQHPAVELADEDAVVARVGDHDAGPAVGGDLAGECERRPGGAPNRGERGADREIRTTLEQPLDHAAKRLPVALAGRHRNDIAVGIDHHQRGPRTDAVLLPRLETGVVEHGMHDPVAGDRALDRGMVELVRELRGVHADDHQPVSESLLEIAQLLDDAEAVDAAERPEIEDHNASAQVAQRQWRVRVDPSTGALQFRRTHTPGRRRRHAATIIARVGTGTPISGCLI